MLPHDANWDGEDKTDNKLKYNFQLFRIAPINDKSLRKGNYGLIEINSKICQTNIKNESPRGRSMHN